MPRTRKPRVGPGWWNLLYYASVIVGLAVGLGTFLNGGTVMLALLRFLVTLLSISFLGASFLTFVVIPLQIKRYNELVQEQRAARVQEPMAETAQAETTTAVAQTVSAARAAQASATTGVQRIDADLDSQMPEATDAALETVLQLRRHLAESGPAQQRGPNGAEPSVRTAGAVHDVQGGRGGGVGADQASGLRQMMAVPAD